MIQHLTQVGVGGIFAIMVLRLVFDFVTKLRNGNGKGRRATDKFKDVQNSVEAVLIRLDRIIERLEDLAASTKETRKQSEVTCEQTERLARGLSSLEQTIGALARRTVDTQPGA